MTKDTNQTSEQAEQGTTKTPEENQAHVDLCMIEWAEWIIENRWEMYDGSGSWINPSRKVLSTKKLLQLYREVKTRTTIQS